MASRKKSELFCEFFCKRKKPVTRMVTGFLVGAEDGT
nr:MAG TPA: hypothetical protein [Caudoviricetes sp.]